MGICSKAKEIVYVNNISDIPINSIEINNSRNEDKNDINSIKGRIRTPSDKKLEETFLKEKEVLEKKRNKMINLKHNSVKKFLKQSTNDIESGSNDNQQSNVGRKRNKSAILCPDGGQRERGGMSKFKRNSQKSVTIFRNDAYFLEKIHGMEMKIPVLQETLITQKFGQPDKYYKKLKDLGSGSYGSVYKARNLIMDNIVAIKTIEKVQENMVEEMEIKNEINILKSLSHPNIVKIYEFFDTALYYYLVTEYCKKGELFSYITNVYNERQLSIVFYQVFSGLCYLHEKRIIHRDLKLENLMISEIEKDIVTGEEFFWMKIIDFGTAKIFQKNKKEKAIIGSSYYIAPEVLKQKYNEKCDTWSVGVILYMTLVGVAPFDGKTDEEIIKKIKIGKFNKKSERYINHSEEVKDLVNKLLEKMLKKDYQLKRL